MNNQYMRHAKKMKNNTKVSLIFPRFEYIRHALNEVNGKVISGLDLFIDSPARLIGGQNMVQVRM